MKITNWPISERPREKLLALGPHALSDAELLAILLNNGGRKNNVVTLSKLLLSEFGNLRNVLLASQKKLRSVHGIGIAKYSLLAACVEVNKRIALIEIKSKKKFTDVDSASRYLSIVLRDKSHEVFSMLLLDSQHQLIAYREMFQGTIDSAAVYPRELVKQALDDNAAAVILAHNHPSGIPEPSQADIRITEQVIKAMQLLDIKVLDHLIIGASSHTSFAQRGLI